MSVHSTLNTKSFNAAITRRDTATLADLILTHEFLLIHVPDPQMDVGGGEQDDFGALTADFNGDPYLVAFSTHGLADEFTRKRGDLFAASDEVAGFLVDGHSLMDYIGEDYGLLVNPETEHECRVDNEMIGEILDELGL